MKFISVDLNRNEKYNFIRRNNGRENNINEKKRNENNLQSKEKKKWIFFVFIYLLLGLRCLTKVLSIKSVFFSFFPRE
jgi:hypothetical protein